MTDPPDGAPAPLAADALSTRCDPSTLPFETTADLEPLDEMAGQDRAAQAVRFAAGMVQGGYNLFALGPEGIGKHGFVRRYLETAAAEAPVPDDWCYVHNFAEPRRPRALRLPAGKGRPFSDAMDQLVEELRLAIPAAFESDEYRNRRSVIQEQFKERQEEALGALQAKAKEQDIALIHTPVGLALAPIRDGEVLSPQEFEQLPEEDKKRRKEASERLQKELAELMHTVPRWEREQRERLRELNREVTMFAVGHLMDELTKTWADQPAVLGHLDAVRDDVIEHAQEFLTSEQGSAPGPPGGFPGPTMPAPTALR